MGCALKWLPSKCTTYQLICGESDDFNLAVVGALRIVARGGRPWPRAAAVTVKGKKKALVRSNDRVYGGEAVSAAVA